MPEVEVSIFNSAIWTFFPGGARSIVARRDGKMVAYLVAGSRSLHAQAPVTLAMVRAYPASRDTYLYGRSASQRASVGMVATALFVELRERLPGRDCIAFIRSDSASSLQAHLKIGVKEVASFEAHEVLAFAAPRRA